MGIVRTPINCGDDRAQSLKITGRTVSLAVRAWGRARTFSPRPAPRLAHVESHSGDPPLGVQPMPSTKTSHRSQSSIRRLPRRLAACFQSVWTLPSPHVAAQGSFWRSAPITFHWPQRRWETLDQDCMMPTSRIWFEYHNPRSGESSMR